MNTVREELQIFVRRFGLLNAACCEFCCGEEVSLVQSHILFEIRRSGEPSMQRAAEELGIDVTTFSRQIKTLEKKGLVSRRPAERDRRVSLLGLTAEGTRTLERIDGYMAEKIGQLFTVMSPFEREVVARSFGLLNEALAKVGAETFACCK